MSGEAVFDVDELLTKINSNFFGGDEVVEDPL